MTQDTITVEDVAAETEYTVEEVEKLWVNIVTRRRKVLQKLFPEDENITREQVLEQIIQMDTKRDFVPLSEQNIIASEMVSELKELADESHNYDYNYEVS